MRGTGVGHRFKDELPLFDDLDFMVVPGVITGLVGPSGSGKSTLMGIMAGWIAPAMGTVERIGVDKVNWVFQHPVGVPARTVMDHLALPHLARGMSRGEADEQALELLGSFGLRERALHRFSHLSGGEAQRLMLARSIAVRPDLLLIDEPTAQLDPRTGAQVVGHMQQLRGEERMVVVATHDERTRRACDVVVDLGRP